MSVSITEQLQEVNPEVAFADVKQNFSKPDELAKKLKVSIPKLDTNEFKFEGFDSTSLDNVVTEVPVSGNELKTNISGQINQLNSINIETLTDAIPESPSGDNFKDITEANNIQNNITNLTKDLVGDLSIGEVSKDETTSAGGEEIFGEFNQFVTNAGMLPVRTLEALLKAFKKFLDKLSNPEQLLEQLGSEALTNIFSEQIQSLKAQIPSEAINIIAKNIELRQQEVSKYNEKINQFKELIGKFDSSKILTPEEVTKLKSDIKTIRLEVKEIANTLQKLDTSTTESVENLRNFQISDFQTKLEEIKQVNSDAIVLQPLFDKINQYIDTISEKIASITDNLREFTQKIPKLIDDGINKVESIATNIAGTISQKIEQGEEVLTKLKDYLSEVIQKIKEFIEKTANKSSELVKPFKEISNKASSTVVSKIDEVSGKIQDATNKLETSIGDVNQKIDENLNKEQLVKKIGDFLDQVTAILDGEAVKNALSTAENGINTITTNLDKVTLELAFQTVVKKSGELETKLKAVDISKLSTPSKAALKVGTQVIKQVDIPGTVTPELQTAFQEILDPLQNIIGLIEGEFQKIDDKITSFTPGTLVEEFLSPYLNPVINKLEEYKPSILLQPVKEFYNDILEKMEVINPNQLLEKLEEFYLKLVNVIESLSPDKITDFLKEQLSNVQKQLDELPVETLVKKIKDGLGEIDKLMASLGLGDVLKSDFWQTLQDILSFKFSDKITEIEKIRDKVAEKVGKVDDTILTQELESLKEAIANYVDHPNTAINLTTVTAANTNYQKEANHLLNAVEELKDVTPPAEVIVDYRDLKKRLENIYQDFSATRPGLPEQTVSELQTIVDEKKDNSQGNEDANKKLIDSSNTILTVELITNFKNVIPNEIDRQITNPIKGILGKLDKILEKPREILSDIEKVIEKIAAAPGEIAQILAKVTDKLGQDIRDAIDSLKKVISELTNEVVKTLEETYKIIVETVKKLNPRRLLHIFDESDFEKLNLLIQKIKQPAPEDKVSKYINSKLSDNTKSLLVDPKSDATKTAIINDLNDLLLTDADFYNGERFENIKLTVKGEILRQKTDKDESEIIFFNRLLLEGYYNTPESRMIKMNIESIFHYLKEKLSEIYPDEVVKKLDELHQKIIQLLRDIPQVIGKELDKEYQEKIVQKTQALRETINNLFKALREKLEALKSELDIGLEDVGDSFDRLINAIPV